MTLGLREPMLSGVHSFIYTTLHTFSQLHFEWTVERNEMANILTLDGPMAKTEPLPHVPREQKKVRAPVLIDGAHGMRFCKNKIGDH
jgi:hypothetical protein